MTILGAHVLAPDLAIAWADGEVFDVADRRMGFVNKLGANPAGFAFVMAGWSHAASEGCACTVDAADFATALRRLPGVLRRASERAASNSRYPGLHAGNWGALVGWDAKAMSMVAYRFTAAACFVPELDFRQTVPEPLVNTGNDLSGPHAVRTMAVRQMLRLRESTPHAVGGPLHVAVIRPDSVTLNRLCDLADELPAVAPVKEPADVC